MISSGLPPHTQPCNSTRLLLFLGDFRYDVKTLQPLCSKHLPRTLEQIVQNLGLAVEEDEPGPAALSASHEGEGVPTPVYVEKSAGSVRSGEGVAARRRSRRGAMIRCTLRVQIASPLTVP